MQSLKKIWCREESLVYDRNIRSQIESTCSNVVSQQSFYMYTCNVKKTFHHPLKGILVWSNTFVFVNDFSLLLSWRNYDFFSHCRLLVLVHRSLLLDVQEWMWSSCMHARVPKPSPFISKVTKLWRDSKK